MEHATIIAQALGTAVTKVFETMINLQVTHDPNEDDFVPPPFDVNGICGSVSFAGRMSGVVYFWMMPDLMREVVTRIVGDFESLGEGEINDVVGELTNMITGNVKTIMADRGFNCALSIPSILRGDSISVSGKGFSVTVGKRFTVPELAQSFIVRALVKLDA